MCNNMHYPLKLQSVLCTSLIIVLANLGINYMSISSNTSPALGHKWLYASSLYLQSWCKLMHLAMLLHAGGSKIHIYLPNYVLKSNLCRLHSVTVAWDVLYHELAPYFQLLPAPLLGATWGWWLSVFPTQKTLQWREHSRKTSLPYKIAKSDLQFHP